MSYYSSGFSTERKDTGYGKKFFGKYRAIVTNNKDIEDKMGRIKVKCPSVLGDSESNWCNPCSPFAGPNIGQVFIPNVGDSVWVEFEEGDPDKPIWVGNWWGKKEVHSDVYKNDTAGNQHMIRTKYGRVHFDDENEQLRLTTSSCKITLDGKTGIISIEGNGLSIKGQLNVDGNISASGTVSGSNI